MTHVGNFTDSGGQPMMLNNTRGFIYEYNINESAQTTRWKAYVGNITGELKLGDGTSNIMAWDLTHVTGELFATRYHGVGTTGSLGQGPTGIVTWSTLQCAPASLVSRESASLNHNDAYHVDSLNKTITAEQNALFRNFIVAGRQINAQNNCLGTFLYSDGEAQTTMWQQVALEDTGDSQDDDIMFAVMLENQQVGFNGQTYDYQILLPDNGDPTGQQYAYYFYIELSGETI